MAAYLIRVVLHGATANNYADLHAAMEAAGCERTIRADDGTVYDLPDAEYLLVSFLKVEGLRDRVCDIAEAICPRPLPSVMVTEYQRTAWQLEPVPGTS